MILYHGTSDAYLPAILKEGLIPGKCAGADAWAKCHGMPYPNRHSVFLAADRQGASNFAYLTSEVTKTKPKLVRVNWATSEPLPRDMLSDDKTTYAIPHAIPVHFLAGTEDPLPRDRNWEAAMENDAWVYSIRSAILDLLR